MDFSLGKQRVIRTKGGTTVSTRAHGLPNYEKAPCSSVISLADVDRIVIDRIKVLKKLEECRERFHVLHTDFMKEFVMKPRLHEQMPLLLPGSISSSADLERAFLEDQIGHFLLRLAFCRSFEQTNYLINLEVDLFKFRFHREPKDGALAFISQFSFIEKVSLDEKLKLSEALTAVYGWNEERIKRVDLYKVPFTKAGDLLRKRKSCVLLKGGYVFLPFARGKMGLILTSHLKHTMRLNMNEAYRNLAVLGEEHRLLPRLNGLATQVVRHKRSYLQSLGGETKGVIHRQQLDELAAMSYPPCMKEIHNSLRKNHHLRYGARRQYGQFLKEAGLPMEEHILFMKDEFTKKIDPDKFDRQYSYDIRYIYGKEGRRVEMKGMACAAIILHSQPGPLDCHGCPFAHLETALLTQRLKNCDISDVDVESVVSYSKNSHYDKACTRYFELVHKMEEGSLGQLITHPNQYMRLSQDLHAGRRSTRKHIVISTEETTAAPEGGVVTEQPGTVAEGVGTPGIEKKKKPFSETILDEIMQE